MARKNTLFQIAFQSVIDYAFCRLNGAGRPQNPFIASAANYAQANYTVGSPNRKPT
jgi:hypothetical protein